MKKILKKIRIFLLINFRYKFKKVGQDFYCGKNLFIRPNTIIIGNKVYIGNNAHLSVNELIIKDYVMLASNVSIIGGDHNFNQVGLPIRETGRAEQKKVIIERDAWIGHGATIMHGVTIGEGSIIAAGSLVVNDVPAYSIIGSPTAKLIKMRFNNEEIVAHRASLSID